MALARFQPYRNWRFQWRSRFRASNGKILFVSSEGYWNRGDMLHAIEVMVAEIQKGVVIEGSIEEVMKDAAGKARRGG